VNQHNLKQHNLKQHNVKQHGRLFLFCCALAIALWMLLGSTLKAQSVELLPSDPLLVGLYHNPPFVIAGDEGWDGIGIHLWRSAAEELGIDYEFLVIGQNETVSALLNKEVDVVIGIVANADEEQFIDFTHAYFTSSLGVAELATRTIWEIAGAFFSPKFWRIALWLVVAFLLIGILVWLFERNANAEQFGQGASRGIWSGFWWASVTMTTIGYGDKVPITVAGRLLALLWMIVAMGITAILTATLTSILTLGTEVSATQFPESLRRTTIGTAINSQSAAFLIEERIQFQGYDTSQIGLEALHGGEVALYVDDAVVLRFMNNETFKGALQVSETGINLQHHVFAIADNSVLREPLNRFILIYTQEAAWQNLVQRYVP